MLEVVAHLSLTKILNIIKDKLEIDVIYHEGGLSIICVLLIDLSTSENKLNIFTLINHRGELGKTT